MALGLSCWYFPPFDPDLGWHLVGGRLVLSTGGVPTADPINTFNGFWHDYHWLAQAVIRLIYDGFGFTGLQIALGLLMAHLAKVLVDCVFAASGTRARGAILPALMAFWLVESVTSIRPQMLAIWTIALGLRRLSKPATAWELPYLLVLTALTVNMHVYWVFLPFLWFSHRCLPRFYRRRSIGRLRAWGGLTLLSLCGLASPYPYLPLGEQRPFLFVNYALLFDYMLMPKVLRDAIGEMRGSFAAEGWAPIVLLLAVAFLARGASPRRLLAKGSEAFCAAVSLILAIRTLKFMAIFAVLGLPALSRLSRRSMRGLLSSVARAKLDAVMLVLALGFGIARCVVTLPSGDSNRDLSMLPLEACRRLASSEVVPAPGRDHVRVLTHFNHGGWCRFAIYEESPERDIRVTTDGRTQWVPPDHFQRSFDIFNVRHEWFETLASWNPDAILVSKDKALAQVLIRLPQEWRLLYHDESFAVFLPNRRLEQDAR